MPTLVVPEVVISCAGVTLPRDMWYQPVVVVAYEGGDSLLEVRRSLVGDLVDVPLDGLVIATPACHWSEGERGWPVCA